MMIITNKINLELSSYSSNPPRVDAVQGDRNTRAVEIALTSGGESFSVPSGTAAVVRFRKPDGTGGVYDAMPDGSAACTISGSTVTILLAPQVLTCPGVVRADVALTDEKSVLGAFSFSIHVHADPSFGATVSENYFSFGTLEEINTALAGVSAGLNSIDSRIAAAFADASQLEPHFANSVSQCTDTDKVYVLPDGYLYGYMLSTVTDCTNQIPISLAQNGSIYNTIGYKENVRLSASSDYAEASFSGADLTGYIQVSAGDVVRLRYVTMPDEYSYANKVYFFNSSFIGVNSISMQSSETKYGIKFDADGNLIEFTVLRETLTDDAGYIRIGAGNIDGDSIVTINEEIVEENVYMWRNTGHAFVPANYEDQITSLEANVQSNTNRLNAFTLKSASVDKQLAALQAAQGELSIPDYWLTHLKQKADLIRQAMENAGANKSAFLWYTDAHWTYNSQMSPLLLGYLYQNTAMNKVNFGGDIVNTESAATRDELLYLYEWRKAVRSLPNHHSVIGNHDDEIAELSSEKQIYGYLMAAEESPNIVRGGSFYYYIDDPSEKTRYLYLDTSACFTLDAAGDPDAVRFAVDALATAPAGWHIAAISHIWFLYADTTTPTVGDIPDYCRVYLDLFDACNARQSGAVQVNGTAVSYDFTAAGGHVEFCIGGHTHVDFDCTSDGGIPVILTETDSRHLRSGLSYAAGTISESSVSGIIADYDAGKITVVRIGRGEDREIAL